jgi:hypothetical protein
MAFVTIAFMDTNYNLNVTFDDDSVRIAHVVDHPINHIEPESPPLPKNKEQQAFVTELLNYLFPTADPDDMRTRVVCLAHTVLPELEGYDSIVNVAKILKVSPQAVHQMILRANKALFRNSKEPITEDDERQLTLL